MNVLGIATFGTIGTTGFSGNVSIGNSSEVVDRTITVLSGDANNAGFEAMGNNSGRGYISTFLVVELTLQILEVVDLYSLAIYLHRLQMEQKQIVLTSIVKMQVPMKFCSIIHMMRMK